MPKKPSYLYPMVILALFFLIVAIIFMFPTVQFTAPLIDQNRIIVSVGELSLTVGDVVVLFSLLAASVDVATLVVLLYRSNQQRK